MLGNGPSVSRPLDRLQINALLVHFIERAHITQVIDRPHHIADDVIHLCLGIESAQAKVAATNTSRIATIFSLIESR